MRPGDSVAGQLSLEADRLVTIEVRHDDDEREHRAVDAALERQHLVVAEVDLAAEAVTVLLEPGLPRRDAGLGAQLDLPVARHPALGRDERGENDRHGDH